MSGATHSLTIMNAAALASLAHTVEDLLAAIATGERPTYLHFWQLEPGSTAADLGAACLSQWWTAPIEQFGIEFPAAEHYMMWRKAVLFGDDDAAEEILATPTPAGAKAIGRRVRGFSEDLWLEHRWKIALAATFAKFTSDRELGHYLLTTGDAVIAEASPVDTIWGIGLAEDHSAATDPARWRGLNLLGFALMEVRTLLTDVERIAAAALPAVPEMYGVRDLVAPRLSVEHNGHKFHGGWHVGWAWGQEKGNCYVDLLTEHRHPGMCAERTFADGHSKPIEVPSGFRRVGDTPEEDAKFQRAFIARNNAAYDDLRARGLLPPAGMNVASQDINEHLLRGRST